MSRESLPVFTNPLLLAGDSLANHSPVQENKKENPTPAISGQKCSVSSESYNQCGLWARMSRALLKSPSMMYSTVLKQKDTPRGHIVIQLRSSVPVIEEKESSSLPTPQAYSFKDSHRPGQTKLDVTIRLLPTVTANTAKNTSPGINFEMREKKCHLDGVFMNHLGTRTGLKLQPAFAEWMMGLPIGYTDLPHWVTVSSRNRSTRSSKRSQTLKEV